MAAVHVVNPGKRRKRKSTKNAAKAKGGAVSTKKKRKRRKAKANPAPAATNPRRRRKRRSTSNAPRRRRARRNPDGLGGGIGGMIKALNLPELAHELGAGLGSDLMMGFVVRRFGDTFGTPINNGGGKTSPYAGSAWTGKNYAFAAATAIGGGFIIRQFGSGGMKRFGTQFAREGVKSLIKRLFYTEVMGRSEWMQTTFGSAMRVMDDRNGNRWAQLPDGSVVAMGELEAAGPMGALVGADVYGELTDANYYGADMDEDITEGEPNEDDDADQGTVDARSIDAGAWDVPGPGRRYFPTRPGDVMASVYQRHSAYANR